MPGKVLFVMPPSDKLMIHFSGECQMALCAWAVALALLLSG